MPVLIFNGEVLVESAVICQFLADIYPSHLCPPSTTTEGAMRRARMSFFTDAYWNKFHTILFGLFEAPTEADAEKVIDKAVAGLLKEVEPLLQDANPFFGGSDKLTLAEVSYCFYICGWFATKPMSKGHHGPFRYPSYYLIEARRLPHEPQYAD